MVGMFPTLGLPKKSGNPANQPTFSMSKPMSEKASQPTTHMSLKYLGLTAAAIFLASFSTALADGYYAKEPQFHMPPDPGAARYKIARFGPIGIGLELRQPNFTMHIVNIEEGSPAAAGGELKKGQIIESVNGQVMKG